MHIHFKGIGEGYLNVCFFYITVQSIIRETVENNGFLRLNQAREQNKRFQNASL